MKNKFAYDTERGSVSGNFNVYQSKSGKIVIAMGNGFTLLTKKQVEDLHINVFELLEFDFEDYTKAYQFEK